MIYKFTKKSEEAISIASNIAMEFGHNYIGTEHLLYGLVEEGAGVASKVLENQNITSKQIEEQIEILVGRNEEEVSEIEGFTPRTKRVIENAFRESRRIGSEFIGTEHLLLGILREEDSVAIRILLDLNVNIQKLYNELIKVVNEDITGEKEKNTKIGGSYNQTQTLNQYGTD